MRFLLATSVAVAAMIATAAAAQDFSAQRLSDEIRVISADDFQGRKPGTEGEEKTLAFLQAQYEAMGLQPGGPDGQWRQRIELRRYTPVQGAAALSLTGADGQAYPLVLGTDAIVRAATNDGRADVSDAALVFAGFGVTAPERGWDDYGDVDVRGKVVVVVEGEPDGDLFNGAYTTHYQSAGYKADEAFRRGAVGLVILAGERGWARAKAGADRQRTLTPGAADLEFVATLDDAGKASLAQAAGVDPERLTGGQDGSFKAFELTGALLITAALGAMVLAHRERFERRKTQRELAIERFAPGGHPTTLPNPGVYARHNAVDVPARLPDGSGSELSVSAILQVRPVPDNDEGGEERP